MVEPSAERPRVDLYVNETTRGSIVLGAGRTTTVRLVQARPVRVAELPGPTSFAGHGANLLPAPEGGGQGSLAVLEAVLRAARAHPGHLLVVAGHAVDETLSRQRAAGVLGYLRGQASWGPDAAAQARVVEWQRILAWAAATFGWDCHPGALDDREGPRSRRALHAFRKGFNAEHGAALPLNARVGPDDWRAFAACYDRELARLLGDSPADLAARRAALVVDPAPRGCGGAWPISRCRLAALPSTFDARVDLLLFAPADAPRLTCHAASVCEPKACDVYRKGKYRAAPLTGDAPATTRALRLVLRDVDDRPLAGQPCVLEVGGALRALVSDGAGGLTLEVPEEAGEALLRVERPDEGVVVVPLRVGPLAPAHAPLGQQERLRNLGYYTGDLEGEDELEEDAPDALRSAVEEFQCDQGLPVTGACDPATQARLVEVHGS